MDEGIDMDSQPIRGDDTMNKDEGAYKLNRIFDQLIKKRQPSSTRDDVTRQAAKQLVK